MQWGKLLESLNFDLEFCPSAPSLKATLSLQMDSLLLSNGRLPVTQNCTSAIAEDKFFLSPILDPPPRSLALSLVLNRVRPKRNDKQTALSEEERTPQQIESPFTKVEYSRLNFWDLFTVLEKWPLISIVSSSIFYRHNDNIVDWCGHYRPTGI